MKEFVHQWCIRRMLCQSFFQWKLAEDRYLTLYHRDTPKRCVIVIICHIMKWKIQKNTTMSQQFRNPIEKSQKEVKPTPLIQIHDGSLSWLGTGISIKGGGIKLVIYTICKNRSISNVLKFQYYPLLFNLKHDTRLIPSFNK